MTNDPADLANLRDIVLPPPIPLWPPAPGWWIIVAFVLAAALVLLAKGAMRYRRNAYRREALRELDAVGPARDAAAAQQISAVLKRAALAVFPREDVARLSGAEWLAFLDRTGRTKAFTQGAARRLPAIALGAASESDGEAITAEAKRWIRRHRSARATATPC